MATGVIEYFWIMGLITKFCRHRDQLQRAATDVVILLFGSCCDHAVIPRDRQNRIQLGEDLFFWNHVRDVLGKPGRRTGKSLFRGFVDLNEDFTGGLLIAANRYCIYPGAQRFRRSEVIVLI